MRTVTSAAILVMVVALLSCSVRYLSLSDPALQPFSSMYAIDRAQYGMTPLPQHGRVRVERREGPQARQYGYDVMLHIYDKAIHHVAFRKDGAEYRWVGESEVCAGPRVYDSPDGRLNEQVIISYFDRVRHQQDGLKVTYLGPDEDLKKQLPVARVKSLLAEWGCTGT